MREFEYDEEGTSSYFFVLALLVLYLTGATIWRLCLCFVDDDGEDDTEIEKRKVRKAKNKKPSNLFSTWNIIYVLAWAAVLAIMWQISHMEHEAVYDPFEILELPSDATTKQIKKRYRELSLMYHPDRNPDPEANDMFVRISKAYRALTDDETRENWEKYGNPDGPTTQTYGIALPAWMVQGKHSVIVMIAYAVGFVIIIPAIVRSRWTRSKKYLKKGVLKDTAALFYHSLTTDAVKELGMMEVLSCAFEFRENLKTSQEELGEIFALLKQLPELPNNPWQQKVKGKQDNRIKLKDSPFAVKARTLLYAHMHRLKLSPALTADLDFVLEHAPTLINVMAELCFERRWFKPVLLALHLKQMTIQAVPEVDNVGQLEQLPHVTKTMMDSLEKKNVRTLQNLVMRPDDKVQSILSAVPALHVDDVIEFLNVFPSLEVDWGLPGAVEDEKKDKSGNRIVTAGMPWAITVSVRRVTRHELLQKQQQAGAKSKKAARNGKKAAKGGAANGTKKKAEAAKKKKKKIEIVGFGEGEFSDAEASSSDDDDSNNNDDSKNDSDAEGEEIDEEELWAGIKKPGEDVDDSGPIAVHCPRYPHDKEAEWWCFVSDATNKKIVSGLLRLNTLGTKHTMRPLPMEKVDVGLKAFNLHVICDSYLGADVVLPFKVKSVRPKLPSQAELAAQRRAQAAQEEMMEEEEEEEDTDEDDDDEDF
ncbi:hypothetical protein PTSG_04855 [Salpingoeca rosetta]|uniref:J domain-containing protein n=1 Tax=Salpingoeca rosetta (strain ATCC 50818 / BSB-021) TaxID=946362 RepID=F2U9W5_SALR5|nr:uncharacterized protein PTSG_04855 [Salpingoeca rosetta]EGD73142.1 hypothetical protein PTSG_04855 [Salpingoeca rosetta]|eukprot:XP_004994173.1 hypothetical protein PTSG_04855 [Salpingoeca rosetta]